MKPLPLGKIEVSRISELDMPTSPRFLFPWITPEHFASHLDWLTPHYYDPGNGGKDRILMSIQTFIVRTPHHIILVDTCLGNDKKRSNPHWDRRKGPFLADLKAAGISPGDVDFVMCTHLHVDHVGWNTRLVNGKWEPTFPKARYVFNRKEYDFWKDARDEDQAETFRDSVLPVMESGLGVLVEDEHEIVEGVQLEPTPGHTPGHSSLHLSSRGSEAVITGDMLHHPVQVAEPDWCSRFAEEPDLNRKTRRSFLSRYADSDVRIIGTHFNAPTYGRIVPLGDTWQFQG